jgi:hypothetical protein
MAQVRGHLAMCKGKAIQKGAIPKQDSQPVATGCNSVITLSKANFKGLTTGWQPVAVAPSNNQSVDDRLARLETKVDNEMTHMIVDRNQTVGINDWVSANKDTLIILGIAGLFILLWSESACKCDGQNSRRNSLGSDIARTASTYAIKKILK